MTYNIRYASDEPPHAWPDRRPLVAGVINEAAPAVIGTQEAVYHQLCDLKHDLPGYAWIGIGRAGGSHGEFMAVFYRTDRLLPLEYDHFWLSETPETVGSRSWGTRFPRMVTWIRFRDLDAGAEFYFCNTHFDRDAPAARQRSAHLVAERLKTFDAIPLFLAGDFNALAGDSSPYAILLREGGLTDTWSAAEERGELFGTVTHFRDPVPHGGRIDWILCRGPVRTLRSDILTYRRADQRPSDHLPVIADVQLLS